MVSIDITEVIHSWITPIVFLNKLNSTFVYNYPFFYKPKCTGAKGLENNDNVYRRKSNRILFYVH